MNKRYTAIDIGTNTILMLIAEKSPDGAILPIADENSIARLGEGVDKTGKINENAIKRASSILKQYKKLTDKYSVSSIRIAGTSALRDAKNAKDVREKLENIIETKIDIIPGIREAELSFLGVVRDASPSVVIDIGGGSTEIISGKDKELSDRNSLNIGAVRITERIFGNHPPSKTEISKAIDIIDSELSENISEIYEGKYYAVAGTPTTIAAIVMELKEYDDDKVNGFILTTENTEKVFDHFLELSVDDISNKFNIHPKRADVITAGTLILIRIMKFFSVKNLIVSSHGLRYGIIKEMFDQ